MPILFDSTFILLIPAIIISIYAQAKVHSTFKKYAGVRTARGLTGKEMAEKILKDNGIHDVQVKMSHMHLSDHYNPLKKELRLSPDVYNSDSVSAIGVAAHEVGHAIQHARSYFPLHLRSVIYPAVSVASYLAPILIIAAFFIHATGLLEIGILVYAISVAFTLITLPVEFDASKRALVYLKTNNVLGPQEMMGARSVLNAAALTYLAAAITAILELIRLIIIARNE